MNSLLKVFNLLITGITPAAKTLMRVLPILSLCSCAAMGSVCSTDWKVTGYYSPIESEFPSVRKSRVMVQDLSWVNFNQSFLAEVKLEGWGLTRFGWYLGYYSNKWHKSLTPLDSMGRSLELGTVAIDREYLQIGNTVSIPELNPVLGRTMFVASDTGSAIKRKHIDVYTGEGQLAKIASWKVTGNKRVCVSSTL